MQDLGTRYALLTRLPLLQGISSTDLLSWEDTLRLDLDEFPASKQPLIRQGENCTLLLYLVEGELQREHRSSDGLYATRSLLSAPAVIEVDRLFGLYPTYEYTYCAKTEVKMLSIRKSLLGSHLMKSEVFRLNLLNSLSAIAQKREMAQQPRLLSNAEERLKHFLRTLFPDQEGEAEVSIKMRDLAQYVGERRITVSSILNRWSEEGRIRLGRGHFTIIDIQNILN
ncbi:MAG: Crp/Fnr family transcriptional regulator [Bacteroidaceae bacterium]|nr:Crp/Fnr family transcriptional regulator [Bacteroidaceae bacterium]